MLLSIAVTLIAKINRRVVSMYEFLRMSILENILIHSSTHEHFREYSHPFITVRTFLCNRVNCCLNIPQQAES